MKPTKIYELLVRVADVNLTTVIGVLTDAAEIISLTPYAGEVSVAAKRKSAPARKRGRGVDDIVLESMVAGKHHSAKEIGKKLAAEGFSPTSVYPSLSALCSKKKVRRVAPNTYELA